MRQSPRSAITLLEVLAVIFVLAFLFALLLPAAVRARGAARDVSCQSNLKQLLAGFEGHHNSKNGFPPARTTTPADHGWCVDLLPFIDQAELYGNFKLDKNFHDVANQAVTKTRLGVFQCPEAVAAKPDRVMELGMGDTNYGTQGVPGDYFVNHILNGQGLPRGQRREPALKTQNELQSRNAILDGLSYTTLIHEQAGRPDHYVLGVRQESNKALTLKGWWGAWTSYQHFQLTGFAKDGVATGWECSINCQNGQGVYSFHSRGSYAGFCDGSVRFLKDAIAVEVLLALATRQGGEVLSSSDF